MRKLLFSVALATAAVATVPAAAQAQHRGGYDHRGPNQGYAQIDRQLDQIEQRIQRSLRNRVISQREAFGLRRDANNVRQDLRRAARNGLTGREFAQLRVQVNRLEQRVRTERRDRDGRRG